MNKFAHKLHCHLKIVDMNSVCIEIIDADTQEQWILVYPFREGSSVRKIKTKTKSEAPEVSVIDAEVE